MFKQNAIFSNRPLNKVKVKEPVVLKTMSKSNLCCCGIVEMVKTKFKLKALFVTGPLVCVIRGVVTAYFNADGETTCAPPGYLRASSALLQLRMDFFF